MMILGWVYIVHTGAGIPDLRDGQVSYDAYVEYGRNLANAIAVMTVGFGLALWTIRVVLGEIHKAPGARPMMWIAAGGAYSFVTVVMAGLALGMVATLALRSSGHGAGVSSVYVTHLSSLLIGPITTICCPVFFGALAIVIFTKRIFPRWLGRITVACVFGSMTPMLGFWSAGGPLNLDSGWVGLQTMVLSWTVFSAAVSIHLLRELRLRGSYSLQRSLETAAAAG